MSQTNLHASRRDLLASPLLGMVPLLPACALAHSPAAASPLPPAQTICTPDQLRWVPLAGFPAHSVDTCELTGQTGGTGLYYTLIRWWPGFMSAPHTYATDRFCMVLSGTWWCGSSPVFDIALCTPAKPGSFVRRVAGTPHYDGVIRTSAEPAVIAICGIAPTNYQLVDPSKPGWREA